MQQAKALTPPPLPAELLAAAAAYETDQERRADGAVSVRPMLALTPPGAVGEWGGGALESPAPGLPFNNRYGRPTHRTATMVNGLFAASPAESPGEPLAQQRMVSMTAVVARSLDSMQQAAGSGIPSLQHSISFGRPASGVSSVQHSSSSWTTDRTMQQVQHDVGGLPTVSKKPSAGEKRAQLLAEVLA